MAKQIQAQVVGGQCRVLEEMNTVREVQLAMGLGDGYSATVNGDPANPDHTLRDFDYVGFSQSVKGGR